MIARLQTLLAPLSRATEPWWRAGMSLSDHGGFELAGYLAYMGLISLFPFLVFLTALIGFLGDAQTAETVVSEMFRYMPDQVAATLEAPVRNVMEDRRGDLVTLGILGTIWAASNGVEALRVALGKAYGDREQRSFLRRRLESVFVVLIAAVLLILASALLVLGPLALQIADAIYQMTGDDSLWLSDAERVILLVFRYLFGAAFLTGVLIALHRWLPPVRHSFKSLAPGVLMTLTLWLAASTGLSLYLQSVADYGATYGALGGAIVVLLFFYLTAVIFLYGAELNGQFRKLNYRPRWMRRHRRPVGEALRGAAPTPLPVEGEAKAEPAPAPTITTVSHTRNP